MWKQMTQFKCNGVSAISYKSRRSRITNKFDVAIFFGTFESRGLLSSKLLNKHSCNNSIIVLFEESKKHALRIKHDKILINQVRAITKNKTHIIEGKSIRNVEELLDIIMAKVRPNHFHSEATWFIDMAGSPKPYYLGIIGRLRQRIVSPKLTLFNPTADYEKVNPTEVAFSFTLGFDRYMWVPSMWGKPDPTRDWIYYFFLGFEGNRSYEIYDRFEPRHVNAYIGKPGYKPEYEKIAELKNRDFIKYANPRIIYCDAADAVLTWKTVQNDISIDKYKHNVCLVPLGTKAHALAGGLATVAVGNPAILYQMPRSFRVRDVVPGKDIWLYEIKF